MTNELFDTTPYGPPSRHRSSPATKPTIVSDGNWHALVRVKEVDQYAHRYTGEQTVWGAEVTCCDTHGRRIPIDAGTTVRPCPRCEQA